jgi:hypothetical protein
MDSDTSKVKKMGNPKWVKGMPTPSTGKPKGTKDSPFSPRRSRKLGCLLWRDMEEAAKIDGYASLATWLWQEAKTDPDFRALLQRIVLDKLGQAEVGDTQYELSLKGMMRDVMAAEASASGEAGGQTINVVVPPVLQATEAMRQIGHAGSVESVDVEVVSVEKDDPDAAVEAEEVDDG